MTPKRQTIIITGASKGLGKAISESLLQSDFNLVLISRHMDYKMPLEQNDRLMAVSLDITDDKAVSSLMQSVVARFGSIDVLINNAGIFVNKNLDQSDNTTLDSIIDTNLKGLFYCTRAVIPFMKKQKSGLIVNVGSKITHKTNLDSGRTFYAASKYALEGFSLALQRELQPWKIRVTALLPSTMQTFKSFSSRKFLALVDVAEIVKLIIRLRNVNFDSVIFQSVNQYL